jgi:hypothetical protein
MQEVYPIAFLPRDHALAVAIMSYNGKMNFGLLADYDSVPDIDAIGDWIRAGIEELVELAGGRPPQRGGDGDRAGAGTGDGAGATSASSNGTSVKETALEG